MASLINTTNIDIAYPIAGQDNDSQGFRDNFTNIKSNLDQTKLEIEELQPGVVGELLTYGATGITKLTVGVTDNWVLMVDSTEPTGMKWALSPSTELVTDTSPQLGGNLDVQARTITTSVTNGDIALVPDGTGVVSAPIIQLTGGTGTQGQLSWNSDEETLDLICDGAVLQLGQEMYYHVRNTSGGTIANGAPVMATGTIGGSGRITVGPMAGTTQSNTKFFMGLATVDINDSSDGKVTDFGKVRGVSTDGSDYPITSGAFIVGGTYEIVTAGTTDFVAEHSAANNNPGTQFTAAVVGTGTGVAHEVWADGDVLHVSPYDDGYLTNIEPTSGMHLSIAFVINTHPNNGILQVRATTHDENVPHGAAESLATTTTDVDVVAAAAPTTGQVLTATSGTTATWQTPAAGGGGPTILATPETLVDFDSGTGWVTITSTTAAGAGATAIMVRIQTRIIQNGAATEIASTLYLDDGPAPGNLATAQKAMELITRSDDGSSVSNLLCTDSGEFTVPVDGSGRFTYQHDGIGVNQFTSFQLIGYYT